MSYNLNFYPNDFNQSGFNNMYNPYSSMMNTNDLSAQKIQAETENRLQQINQLQNNFQNPFNQQTNQQQSKKPYYLFCGEKEVWDEFLRLNYSITEQAIFDDYKLFLQAKQELAEEQGKSKIDTMKDRIRNKDVDKRFINVDSTIKSNVKPNIQPTIEQPVQYQPTIVNGNSDSVDMGYSSEPNNGLSKQCGFKPKNTDRKK